MLSQNYKHWISVGDGRRCVPCKDQHGKIYPRDQPVFPWKLHAFCRCQILRMTAITAGTATKDKSNGADWWIKHKGRLPPYYIDKAQALSRGWKKTTESSSWLSNVAPGHMIGGNTFYNSNGHLPDAPGRIWYEADINYRSGTRNTERLLYSNDGLMFATYDHYRTFIEVI